MDIEAFDLIDIAHFGTVQDFMKKYKKEDINKQNKYGYSCIHRAIGGHHWDTVNFLLDEGIDVNLKNKNGYTALHYMITHMKDNYEEGMKILKRLLDMGADVNEPAKDLTTPFIEASVKSNGPGFERWKLLLNYNADIYFENKSGTSCYSLAKEFKDPETWNSPDLWNYLVENGFIKEEQ